MRIRSIGTRLIAWYTILFVLTFILLSGAAYGLMTYSLSKDLDVALSGVANVIAQQAKSNQISEIDKIFRRFFGFSPGDPYVDLLDPLGRRDPKRTFPPHTTHYRLSPEALKNASRGLPTYETVPSSNQYPIRLLTMPIMEAGQLSNLVQVGMSLENMYRTQRRFLLMMAYVLPLGLLLAGGGGWLLARRALRQVDQMTQTARRISGRHMTERLEETGNGDELDRLAKTLNNMLERIDDTVHQMRRFSADASHELQTPLTILKGEMEVALRSQRTAQEYQAVLKSGLEEIERISNLVAGLLLLARADAGGLILDRRLIDLDSLLAQICEQMKVVANNHEVTLRCKDFVPVAVYGDQEHLRRLLLNLIDNAIKYTPAGGTVTLCLASDDMTTTVIVADTGIGISEQEQAQIFDRFHRSTETRARDERGVGLGLSIAQSIAQAHGGRIEVDSTPNQGSTFRCILPIPDSEGTPT